MRKPLLWVVILLAAFSLITIVGCAKKEEPKPKAKEQQKEEQKETPKDNAQENKLIFVSSGDKPEACGTCHVKDNSLNAQIKKVKGHPQVQANTVSECASCHKKEGYPPLNKIIHNAHYKGNENAFVNNLNGSCVHCHKGAEGGGVFIPGLATAEAKAIIIEAAQVDKAPNGCLDCHKGDYSLPNMIKKISGHPPVDFEDFNQCYNCHGVKAPLLGLVLHKEHINSDAFKNNYGNSCLNCHKLMDDGNVVVKGKKQE